MSTPTMPRNAKPIPPVSPQPAIWPLMAGDQLDQKTFHQRYQAMPSGFRAELIEGMVIVPSPVGPDHSKAHAIVMGWLVSYEAATPGTWALDNATTILGETNEVQPDALLMLRPEAGGQARIGESGVVGAPELVIEVAYASSSYDLGSKKRDYERFGVREYVVVKLWDEDVKWFRRQDERWVEVAPDADGVYRSATFPGLWLDSVALLAQNAAGVIATLRRGLASPEHAAFIARLQQALGG